VIRSIKKAFRSPPSGRALAGPEQYACVCSKRIPSAKLIKYFGELKAIFGHKLILS